jgi:hypothetical protein
MPATPHERLDELSRLVRDTQITSRELRACRAKLIALWDDPALKAAVEPVVEIAEAALRRMAGA